MYFTITNDNATLDPNTGHWYIDLPEDFSHTHRIKRITVNTFTYYITTLPLNQTDVSTNDRLYVSLHSPTLCDGNFSQNDYFITGLCKNYAYNTIYKTYPIKTRPQKIEFWFKNELGNIVKDFQYIVDKNINDGPETTVFEKFVIEMNLEIMNN